MRVLLVGSGGREHALAWKAASSPRLEHLFVAPGNAGTAGLAAQGPVANLAIAASDSAALTAFAVANAIDLVIIGPEGPLAAGLADDLRAAGKRVFGPSKAAAQIEASKAFAKAFMARHSLPTARYMASDDFETALAHVRSVDYPVVLKASGLAAGKGVILPESPAEAEAALRRIMLAQEFGAAGSTVVIEERLSGPEVSLLAFSDGVMVRSMPPAQDHKNLLDGDQGPNTGGMGACAPICPPAMVEELARQILQPAIDGLRAEGRPFTGVLYAGLMLTPAGPRVLEFNCRFGDPETQAILPLLDTDLLDVAEACVDGKLAEVDIRWKAGAVACVVMASEGYPGQSPLGRPIHGLDAPLENACGLSRLHPIGRWPGGHRRRPCSGRDGLGRQPARGARPRLPRRRRHFFRGQHYRRDIGHRALERRREPVRRQRCQH